MGTLQYHQKVRVQQKPVQSQKRPKDIMQTSLIARETFEHSLTARRWLLTGFWPHRRNRCCWYRLNPVLSLHIYTKACEKKTFRVYFAAFLSLGDYSHTFFFVKKAWFFASAHARKFAKWVPPTHFWILKASYCEILCPRFCTSFCISVFGGSNCPSLRFTRSYECFRT